jgi:hypothetical protein
MQSFTLNHETLTNKEYHARPELGSSTLKTLDRDGAEMCSLRQAGVIESDSRALVIGSAVHAFVEGDLSKYIEAPDARGYKTTDSDTFNAASLEAEAAGKILLSRAEYATVRECSAGLARKFSGYLIGRQNWVEPSLFWNQQIENGSTPGEFVSCKCRPDILVDHGDGTACYLEIKTAADNGPRAWKSTCWRYGYWLQQAHYEAGIRAATGCSQVRTIFVVVRKPAPYVVRIYEFDPVTQAAAERKWMDLLRQYSRRLLECDWQDEIGLNPTSIDLGMSVQDDLEGDD